MLRRTNPCPACNGSGVSSWGPMNATGRNDAIVECDDCKGTGVNPALIPVVLAIFLFTASSRESAA